MQKSTEIVLVSLKYRAL